MEEEKLNYMPTSYTENVILYELNTCGKKQNFKPSRRKYKLLLCPECKYIYISMYTYICVCGENINF